MKELQTNLKDVATYFHAAAQKSRRPRTTSRPRIGIAADLQSFPDAPDSAATNYLLADALFESHQYLEAAAEYEHTAYGYPQNARSADRRPMRRWWRYQKGEERPQPARPSRHGMRRAIDAGLKFAQAFPEHPESAGVLTRAAEDIFAAARSAARDPGRAG